MPTISSLSSASKRGYGAGNLGIAQDGLVLHLDPMRHILATDNNILTPSSWSQGQANPVGGFYMNGDVAENYRYFTTDPFGNHRALIWEARPSGNGQADGGWNHNTFSVSSSNTYRFAYWFRATVLGDGYRYFGTNGYGAVNNLYQRTDGADNGNAYFWYGNSVSSITNWLLCIGHVWPAGSGTGANKTTSGFYNTAGTKIAEINYDFVMKPETTSLSHRTYQYYSGNAGTRNQWIYPRVDLVNGSEPSISDLINNNLFKLQEFSKLGAIGQNQNYTAKDLGSFYFDGDKNSIRFPWRSEYDFSRGQTICMTIRTGANSTAQRRNPYDQAYGGGGTVTHEPNQTFSYYCGDNGGNGSNYIGRSSTFTVGPNETAHVVITRDQTANQIKWYKNGVLYNTDTTWNNGATSTANGTNPISIGGGYVESFQGYIYDMSVYTRALTQAEIDQNFNYVRWRVGL